MLTNNYNYKTKQSSIENRFPHIKIKLCVIPRERRFPIETQDGMDAKKNQLESNIKQCLPSTDGKRFRIEMKPVSSDKQAEYEAKIWCQNANDCQTLMSSNVLMGIAKIRFTPELRSDPITMPITVYYCIKEDLEKRVETMTGVSINANEKKRHNNGKNAQKVMEITVEANNGAMEQLRDANKLLLDVSRGEQVQCNERQFRFFMTPIGREFIEELRSKNT